MMKKAYIPFHFEKIEVEPQKSILAASIVSVNTEVVIPHGQKVEDIDVSTSEFSHEWN